MEVFNTIEASCRVDFGELDYISSAGLGVLLKAQKRLSESGQSLTLANMNNHIKDVFVYAGFDAVFTID
jgi:anti-sigma B factor antagonist